MKWKIYTPV